MGFFFWAKERTEKKTFFYVKETVRKKKVFLKWHGSEARRTDRKTTVFLLQKNRSKKNGFSGSGQDLQAANEPKKKRFFFIKKTVQKNGFFEMA